MKYSSRLIVSVYAFLLAGAAYANQVEGNVNLLQPLGGSSVVGIQPGYGTFIQYFNQSRNWIFDVAVGFAVVWVLIGGFLYMTSGNNQSRRGEAISRITWAITGLLILLFAGFILRTLNSVFFVV